MKNCDSNSFLALDLGATKFAYCLSEDRHPASVTRVQLPRLGDVEREFETVAQVLIEDRPSYSGVPVLSAAPNLVDGVVRSWPNRPHWEGFPLLSKMESVLGVRPVTIADGEASAVADAGNILGAYYLSLTFGTGVAGGVACNGDIVRLGSMSSEFGHIVTDPDGRLCSCGAYGCFQTAWVAFREGSSAVQEFVHEIGRLVRVLGRVFPGCVISFGGRFFNEDRVAADAALAEVACEVGGDSTAPKLRLSTSGSIGPLLGGLILAGRLQNRHSREAGQAACA